MGRGVRLAGAVAFLLGMVGIAVGAGIAMPYESKLGFTPMTATGLVCVLPPAFRRRPLDAGDPSARGLAFSDAEFSTSDGVLLSGWYLPARDGAAVALLHGSGSTRTDVLEQAEGLSHNGFGVLMFDARGHGGSAEQRIRAVVAEGATGRTAADREWLSAA